MFFDFKGAADEQMQQEIVNALKQDRASMAMMSGLKSAVFILIVAGLIWAFVTDKIKSSILIGGLAVVVAMDLWPVAKTYLGDEDFTDASDYEAVFQPRKVDRDIMQDKDPYYRVLDLSRDTYNDAVQAYFHKCVGGYSPAKMEIYQDLIDRHLSKGFNSEVLNMLNTKYIIVGGQKNEPQVMPNPAACGNAWFVDEIKWVATADDEINGLNAARLGDTTPVVGGFQPKHTAIIRDNFKPTVGSYTFGKDSAAFVKLDKYGLNEISFVSNNSRDGFAIFSDIYYEKGWKALVDGKETPIVRADYVLRGIKIPMGPHKIEFRFHPDSYYTGKNIAMISSIILILVMLGAIGQMFVNKNKVA
jgi:uncharacterized membrane protein YfhO